MNITSLCFDLRSDYSYQNGLCSLFQVICLIWSGLIHHKTKLIFPATQGFVYSKITDPNEGKIEIINVKRSDGKRLPQENIWLSKTRNEDLSWSYFINLFDVNSTGEYSLFENPLNQFIGTSGDDTLVAGPGTSYLSGSYGNDTYIIHKGDGSVTINDGYDYNDKDKVVFADLKATDIDAMTLPDNETLVITCKTGDKVTFMSV